MPTTQWMKMRLGDDNMGGGDLGVKTRGRVQEYI
jgi:hypothetical protein